MSPALIRPATAGDVRALVAIEAAAAERFRTIGMDEVADRGGMDTGFAASFVTGGLALVAEIEGTPVGFALASSLDGLGHLYELSVHPAFGRQGIGTALLEAVCAAAREAGLALMTLSTFRTVPWNAPFYARLGFAELPPERWTPGLQVLHQRERDAGLGGGARLFMAREP